MLDAQRVCRGQKTVIKQNFWCAGRENRFFLETRVPSRQNSSLNTKGDAKGIPLYGDFILSCFAFSGEGQSFRSGRNDHRIAGNQLSGNDLFGQFVDQLFLDQAA